MGGIIPADMAHAIATRCGALGCALRTVRYTQSSRQCMEINQWKLIGRARMMIRHSIINDCVMVENGEIPKILLIWIFVLLVRLKNIS